MISAHYIITRNGRPSLEEQNANIRSIANAVPWRLAHREKFAAKAPGLVNGWVNAANAFCLYPLTVELNRQTAVDVL